MAARGSSLGGERLHQLCQAGHLGAELFDFCRAWGSTDSGNSGYSDLHDPVRQLGDLLKGIGVSG